MLEICKRLDATDYTNPIGGIELYHQKAFGEQGVTLHFLEAQNVRYEQCGVTWMPFLSIIDVMMLNSMEDIQVLLSRYRLVESRGHGLL